MPSKCKRSKWRARRCCPTSQPRRLRGARQRRGRAQPVAPHGPPVPRSLHGCLEGERRSSLTFGWSVLDFGLSYVRARQAADQALIEEETRRKVVNKNRRGSTNRLLARGQWRASACAHEGLERRTSAVMAKANQLSDGGQVSPLQALTYQRELISIRRDIETLEGELLVAKSELASLINIPRALRSRSRTRSRKQPRLASRRGTSSRSRSRTGLNSPKLRSRSVSTRKRRQRHCCRSCGHSALCGRECRHERVSLQ